jgi:hypothetical protein
MANEASGKYANVTCCNTPFCNTGMLLGLSSIFFTQFHFNSLSIFFSSFLISYFLLGAIFDLSLSISFQLNTLIINFFFPIDLFLILLSYFTFLFNFLFYFLNFLLGVKPPPPSGCESYPDIGSCITDESCFWCGPSNMGIYFFIFFL